MKSIKLIGIRRSLLTLFEVYAQLYPQIRQNQILTLTLEFTLLIVALICEIFPEVYIFPSVHRCPLSCNPAQV